MSDVQKTTTNVYRIESVSGGYEAQMLYQCGAARHEEWFPLNPNGYWSDPDAFSFGLINKRHVFATREEADASIKNARVING